MIKKAFRIPFGDGVFVYAFALLMIACAICACAEGQTTQPASLGIVGVWSQPTSSLAGWKARGVNTIVRWENQGGTVSVDQYFTAAKTLGLNIIAQDDGTATAHYGDSNCIAIDLPDEPNGAGALTPAQCLTRSQAIRAATTKPVFLNFDGWQMQYRSDAEVWAYCQTANWIGFDYYIINRGEAAGIGAWQTKVLPQVQRLQRLAPGKPIILFIESSNQDLAKNSWANQPDASGTPPGPRMRGPTTAEFMIEANFAVKSWGWSIAYFPDVIGIGWESFDGTTPDIALAMTSLVGK